jgi:hypothetical protein
MTNPKKIKIVKQVISNKKMAVKSHYASNWTGIILDSFPRRKTGDLLLILVIKDRNGTPLKKRLIKILDEAWVTRIGEMNVEIRPDWIEENTSKEIERFYKLMHKG